MAVDVDEFCRRGGRELLDLLEYCVISVKMDPMFIFLASEYRYRPSAAGAVTLFDMFCAVDAPARISVRHALPPRNLQIGQAVSPYRCYWPPPTSSGSADDEEEPPARPPVPGNYLFDSIVKEVRSKSNPVLTEIERQYDPRLTPVENLPGGRMTAGQKAFVDQIWLPHVRPHLVGAGFWRIACVA